MAAANAQQMFQSYLDKSTPYTPYRWGGTGVLFLLFGLRIFFAQGWYIGTPSSNPHLKTNPPPPSKNTPPLPNFHPPPPTQPSPNKQTNTQTFTLPPLTSTTVAYSLGIYLLNLFLAFLSPKFDPALEQDEGMEDGNASGLPTKEDQEFRPFVRRLPEFKFWYSTTKAIAIGFFCSWFEIFNLPVFWPVLVVYWLILFGLTSKF